VHGYYYIDEQVPATQWQLLPRNSKYVAWEPETVNRKDLQVTKSLEASPSLTKQVLGSFATR
jgi:hypothetical protein